MTRNAVWWDRKSHDNRSACRGIFKNPRQHISVHGIKNPTTGTSVFAGLKSHETAYNLGFYMFLRMIVLLQILIPLSLYITIEIVKLFQAFFISNDLEMYSEEFDAGVVCRSLNITEELGNVQAIFSDKTGTLTENQMVFRCASVKETNYEHAANTKLILKTKSKTEISDGENLGTGGRSVRKPKSAHFRKITEDQRDQTKSPEPSETENYDPEINVFPDSELLLKLKSFDETDVDIRNFFLCLSCCNSVVLTMEQRGKKIKDAPETPKTRTPLDSVRDSFSTLGRKLKSVPKKMKRRKKSKSSQKSNEQPEENLTTVNERAIKPNTVDAERKVEGIANPTFSPDSPIRPQVDRTQLRLDLTAPKHLKFADDTERADFLKEKDVLYESESPDEAALVYASKAYGVTLMARSERSVRITWPREGVKTFKCRYVLPFDSSRKMMSVILEDPDDPSGSLILTKGADSAVFSRVKNNSDVTKDHVDAYADDGLRTLCLAYRRISQQETLDIIKELADAEISGDEQALSTAFSLVEKDLHLVGATAIEDRLQDGVEESIRIIREAKIKLWVLTGDKVQTAVEVGRSCNLIKRTDHLQYLIQEDADDALRQFLKMRGHDDPDKLANTVLVISGSNLEYILANEMKKFIKFCNLFGAVLCCRTTPKLKGDVVASVRQVLNLRSLSIGDGANDVTMIQEANIGVGISGHEGRQAVMASDYAMPRFRMLPRLLLVHGHWNYARIAQLIEYFFYKNALFILLIFIYQGFSGWSGANFIPDLYLILFMLLFNSIPPIINATIDRFLPSKLLMKEPSLYQFCAENKSYQPFLFWVAMLDSILQASVQFFIPLGIFYDANQFAIESTISVWTFGTIVAAGCLLATFFHLGIDTMSWTWAHIFFLIFSYALFLVIGLASNALPSTGQNEYWIMEYLFSDLWSWLTVIMVAFLSVLPRFIIKVLANTFSPSAQYFYRKKHYQSNH